MRSIRLLNAFFYEYSPLMFYTGTLCPDTFDRHLYVYISVYKFQETFGFLEISWTFRNFQIQS